MIVTTLAAIIWITQSVRYFTLIANTGIDLISFVRLSLYLIPSYLNIVFPIASFVAVIFYYFKIEQSNELTILRNIGLNNFKLFNPALISVLLFIMLNYLISFYMMPYFAKQFREKIIDFKNNYINFFLEENVFNNKIKNLTIYVENKLPNNVYKNIIICDLNKDKQITIIAKYGMINSLGDKISFKFIDGSRQEIDDNKKLSILHFANLSYYKVLPKKRITNDLYESNEKYLSELYDYYKNNSDSRTLSELNQRVIWPIYNFIMTLIALSIFKLKNDNTKFKIEIIKTSLIACITVVSYFILNNLAQKNKLFVVLIFIKICLLIIFKLCILYMEPKIIEQSKKYTI